MARESFHPDRGDLVHLSFNPSAGHEQAGPRYAIVLTPRSYNRQTGLAVCCPITSHVKGHPFEVPVAGKTVKGVVLVDHLRSVDYRERNMSFAEKGSQDLLNEVVLSAMELIDHQK